MRTYFNIANGAVVICSSGVDRKPEIKFSNGKTMPLREAIMDVNLQELAENLNETINKIKGER